MAHKRGVYHRRKHNLKTLFPTNHEQYLCLTFSLEETVLMRMIICNENLVERPEIWAYAGERVKNTPIRAAFGTLNKQDYLVLLAIDRFNTQGLSSYVSIHTAKQFVMAVEMLVQEFEQEVLNNAEILKRFQTMAWATLKLLILMVCATLKLLTLLQQTKMR